MKLSTIELIKEYVNAMVQHVDLDFDTINNLAMESVENGSSRAEPYTNKHGNFFVIVSHQRIFDYGLYSTITTKITDSLFPKLTNTAVLNGIDGAYTKENTSFFLLTSGIILVHDHAGTAKCLHDVLNRKDVLSYTSTINTHVLDNGTYSYCEIMMMSCFMAVEHLDVVTNIREADERLGKGVNVKSIIATKDATYEATNV